MDYENKYNEPCLPSNLDEAANKFAVFYDQGTCDGIAQDCFIGGAKWQKEQMMKEAVEGEVIFYGGLWQFYAPDLDIVLRKLDEGDKVKIIIVKED